MGARSDLLPIRWDPCAPIDVLVNEGPGTQPGSRAVLDEVLAEASRATGLQFRIQGSTALPADTPVLPAGIEVIVEFVSFRTAGLPEEFLGIGGPRGAAATVPDRWGVAGAGMVRVNTDHTYAPGWGSDGYHTLIAHEVGHLLGLQHTRSTGAELMGLPGPRASGYGPGDRAGLHYVYGRGCVAALGAQDASTVAGDWFLVEDRSVGG